MILMHEIHHKYSPPSLHNLFQLNADRNVHYELRNQEDYFIPKLNYQCLKSHPFISLPKIWNSATPTKLIANPYTFKRALKDEFFGINEQIALQLNQNYDVIYALLTANAQPYPP